MIIARQCMFIIIVIGSYFILKWCKIIFFLLRYEFSFFFALAESSVDVCGMLDGTFER
jgi:hypothetical protein